MYNQTWDYFMYKHVHMFTDTHIRIQIANIYKYATNAHTYIKQQKKKRPYIYTHILLSSKYTIPLFLLLSVFFSFLLTKHRFKVFLHKRTKSRFLSFVQHIESSSLRLHSQNYLSVPFKNWCLLSNFYSPTFFWVNNI